jgi:hypothetical protein
MRGQLITTLAVCNSKSATVAAAVCLPCGCTRSSSSTSNERTLTLPGPWPAQRSLPPNLIRQKRRHQLPRRPDAAGRPAGRQAKIHQLPRAGRPQSCHSPDDLFTAMRLRASVRLAVSVLFSSDDTASRLGDGE